MANIKRLRKLADALKNLPESFIFYIFRTVATDANNKIVGGCAWGYSPKVFPKLLKYERNLPFLKDTIVFWNWNSWADCREFYNLTENEANQLFHSEDLKGEGIYEHLTAQDVAEDITKFCDEIEHGFSLIIK